MKPIDPMTLIRVLYAVECHRLSTEMHRSPNPRRKFAIIRQLLNLDRVYRSLYRNRTHATASRPPRHVWGAGKGMTPLRPHNGSEGLRGRMN